MEYFMHEGKMFDFFKHENPPGARQLLEVNAHMIHIQHQITSGIDIGTKASQN